MPEAANISKMFSQIASRYDTANSVLSGGIDWYWRKKLVRLVAAQKPKVVVDLATGSGEVAFALRRKLGADADLRGLDFCEPMLEQARLKQAKMTDLPAPVQFGFGDCLNLALPDNSVDAMTIAFGVRNFEDRDRGLSEFLRVLKPGGSICILEFSQPYLWFRPFYYAYLKLILPTLAKVCTGNRDAYRYLGDSIETFPNRTELAAQIRRIGFSSVKAYPLTFGVVAIHRAVK